MHSVYLCNYQHEEDNLFTLCTMNARIAHDWNISVLVKDQFRKGNLSDDHVKYVVASTWPQCPAPEFAQFSILLLLTLALGPHTIHSHNTLKVCHMYTFIYHAAKSSGRNAYIPYSLVVQHTPVIKCILSNLISTQRLCVHMRGEGVCSECEQAHFDDSKRVLRWSLSSSQGRNWMNAVYLFGLSKLFCSSFWCYLVVRFSFSKDSFIGFVLD